MILDMVDVNFKTFYYPTTQHIFDSIDYEPSVNDARVSIVNLNLYRPIKIEASDVDIFNMAILEVMMLHVTNMIDGEYIEDMVDEIDNNLTRSIIGYKTFDKYRPLLTRDRLQVLSKSLFKFIHQFGYDTVLLGWMKKGNRYDAGFVAI